MDGARWQVAGLDKVKGAQMKQDIRKKVKQLKVMADQAILATPDATKPVDRSTSTSLSALPLVSVIIPTWQEATTLQRCLTDLARNE